MRFDALHLCSLSAKALRAQPGVSVEPLRTWIDADTAHRMVRLTGGASLYFNQNAYTADGKKLVYTTPGGISVLNLESRASKPVVAGRVRVILAGSIADARRSSRSLTPRRQELCAARSSGLWTLAARTRSSGADGHLIRREHGRRASGIRSGCAK